MDFKISITTVSQLGRFNTLQILKNLIEEQTFFNYIIEWVIVETSKTKNDAKQNKSNIENLKNQTKINIKYIEYEENRILGKARNLTNDNAIGDYIVCMDDDDYYHPEYVEHCVLELSKSDRLIAGCTGIYIYDYLLNKLFFTGNNGDNFTSNSCMAYKKEYTKNHKYIDNAIHGEEATFTNDFIEPMIQLNPKKTVVMSSHNLNTYNKRELLISGSLHYHKSIVEANIEPKFFIPEKYFYQYKNIFINNKDTEYDIVYACGFFGIPWNPSNTSLGGSEQAIVQLTSRWATKYKVAVYGCVPEMTYNNVKYFPMKDFPYNDKFKILIIWRENGIFSVLPYNVNAQKIYIDLHDNMKLSTNFDLHKKLIMNAHKIFLKSNFHRIEYENALGFKIPDIHCSIIPNGVQIDIFKQFENLPRNKYVFISTSCYTRCVPYLINLWSIISKLQPLAELHMFYGFDYVKDENMINLIKNFLLLPNVMNHGKVNLDIISRYKHTSSFHLYITNSPLEIDCISIKESLVAGCIPILANSGLYKERDGIKFDVDFDNLNTLEPYQNLANQIVSLTNLTDETLDDIRNKLKTSNTVISWDIVANQWIKEM